MLTAKRVERTKTPGRYRDGLVPGLLLQIGDSGAKSWVLRYMLHGKERMMGIGPVTAFNLREARERARSRPPAPGRWCRSPRRQAPTPGRGQGRRRQGADLRRGGATVF